MKLLRNDSGAGEPRTAYTKSRISRYKDPDGNEISRGGKIVAGILLIVLTAWSALYLIGHWPDRVPAPKDNILGLYTYEWFHVRLANIPDRGSIIISGSSVVAAESGRVDTVGTRPDTMSRPDSPAVAATITAQPAQPDTASKSSNPCDCGSGEKCTLIHINTLLLILVAIAGFLGNMIYLSTSFTTFIGAGKFKKSWLLWYCVKPFTAASLAVAMYFVFRGGFLNMSDDSTNINIYGMITLSLLTGLFTDRATVKLKEIFEVILRPKDERPGKLEGSSRIMIVTSEPLEAGKATTITISGQNLTTGTMDVSIEGEPITVLDRRPEVCSFSYTLPEALKDQDTVTLTVRIDEESSEYELDVKSAAGPEPAGSPENSNTPGDHDQETLSDPADIVPDGPDLEEGDKPIVQE